MKELLIKMSGESSRSFLFLGIAGILFSYAALLSGWFLEPLVLIFLIYYVENL